MGDWWMKQFLRRDMDPMQAGVRLGVFTGNAFGGWVGAVIMFAVGIYWPGVLFAIAGMCGISGLVLDHYHED